MVKKWWPDAFNEQRSEENYRRGILVNSRIDLKDSSEGSLVLVINGS